MLAVAALSAAAVLPRGPLDDAQLRLPRRPTADNFGPLQLRPDGTFQISIFEDLHFGESASTSFQQAGSGRVLTQGPFVASVKMPGTSGVGDKTSSRSR